MELPISNFKGCDAERRGRGVTVDVSVSSRLSHSSPVFRVELIPPEPVLLL